MKTGAVIIVFGLLVLPLIASGAKVDKFQGGNVETVANLSGLGHSAVANITIPAECYVLNATMHVTGLAAQGVYPLAPEVLLNDTVLWAFNGTGYGALGMQSQFSDGTVQLKTKFGASGGTANTAIRLPKEALVENATVAVNYSGPMVGLVKLVNHTGSAKYDNYGESVSLAGDVNGDGYDDLIIGAIGVMNWTGSAYIYFGGRAMGKAPNMTLSGTAEGDVFGISVSTAGDVNGDGYDDVIVGSYGYLNDTGRAYVYFGGPMMDNITDVTITGVSEYDFFGASVSTAGDVNNDGYADVIVGSYSIGNVAGRADLYFGGPSMDNLPDVTFTGAAANDQFGAAVSTAGDVNNDGYDDVIVGAWLNDSGGHGAGRAYIYFGGPAMDNISDVNFSGGATGNRFGISVSNAGDVNGDGYDDIIVGAEYNYTGGYDAGAAYIYFGGPAMDNISDVFLAGTGVNSYFGCSVSTAGDVNNDGYDDVIVGAFGCYVGGIGLDVGCAYLYYGGKAMDNMTDATFIGSAAGDDFGGAVSDAGDVNKDGYSDIIVGANGYETNGTHVGAAYIYSQSSGVLNPNITVGSSSIWNNTGFFNGTTVIGDFSDNLNGFLRNASVSGNGGYGYFYVDVPMNISGKSEGNATLFDLSVVYQYNATLLDFASPLNNYILAHKGDKDAKGNISVPVVLCSQSAGGLKLFNLNITYDGAPMLVEKIPDLAMDEDTINNTLLDLFGYFLDGYDQHDAFEFSIAAATNSSIVNVSIFGNRFLGVDALTGDANDNWTGVVSMSVRCKDSHGLSTVSGLFDVIVRNVNDPPVFTSSPPTNAGLGTEYGYQLIAIDGDNDLMIFNLLQKPGNMTVTEDGKIRWIPYQRGIFDVSVSVRDRHAIAYQNFSINVTGNNPPKFTGIPVTITTVGVQYIYEASAIDDDDDILSFSLVNPPAGVSINHSTGRIAWIPTTSQIGAHPIIVGVADGQGAETEQTFVITVNTPAKPECSITSPANGTTIRNTITIRGNVTKGDAGIVYVQVRIDGGGWQNATGTDNWTFKIDTIKLMNGSHKFEARAFDGAIFSDPASVRLVVDNLQLFITSGNNLWWIIPVAVLIAVVATGRIFWRARRSRISKK